MEHNDDEGIIKQNPMLNNCVLQNVLQYMNVSELKNLRKINSTWNTEAMFWLRRKSIVRFEYNYNNLEELLAEWRTQLSSYVNIMKYLRIEGFSFEMFPIGKSEEERKDCAIKLATLVEDFGHEIKYLELTYRASFQGDINSLENILSCVRKSSALTHLKLNIVVEINRRDGDLPHQLRIHQNIWNNFRCEELPSIQRLELCFDQTNELPWNELPWNWNRYDLYERIAEKICDLFPKLKSLEITTSTRRYYSSVSINILNIKTCNRLETFRSLKGTGRMVPVPHIDFIKSLSTTFPNLSRLDINLPVVNKASEIQNLFDRQAPTLKEFTFCIPAERVPVRRRPIEISMPSFPNLKKLAVKHQITQNNQISQFHLARNNFRFTFTFLDDSINYKTQFPQLTELRLGNYPFCGREGSIWTFYEIFIPALSDNDACEQIKVLNVPFMKSDDMTIMYPCLYPLKVMSRLARMFPSIQNPYLEFGVKKYNEMISHLTDDSGKKNLRTRKPISYSTSKN